MKYLAGVDIPAIGTIIVRAMNGIRVALNIPAGEILLRALLRHGAELSHDCGGVLACASCRVIVREGLERLGAASDEEEDLLDRAGTLSNSRLACQAVSEGGEFAIEVPAAVAGAVGPHDRMREVSLSEAAARHFARQLADSPRCTAVRVKVTPTGCSGFVYRVELTEGPKDTDAVFESAGITMVVDSRSLPQVQGARIDLVRERLATRLQFDNPNVVGACGCGKSFRTA